MLMYGINRNQIRNFSLTHPILLLQECILKFQSMLKLWQIIRNVLNKEDDC